MKRAWITSGERRSNGGASGATVLPEMLHEHAVRHKATLAGAARREYDRTRLVIIAPKAFTPSGQRPYVEELHRVIDAEVLGATIERADIVGLRACVESARRIAPHLGAEAIEVDGGIAPFVGISSPLSEATGLGIFGKGVIAGEVDRLTDFYVRRRTPPRVLVSPLATMRLPILLAKAGYRPIEHQNVLACEIAAGCERDDRFVESHDPQSWGRASAAGFTECAECGPSEDAVLTGIILGSIPAVTILEARCGANIVATGAMDVQGDLAGLFAGSTAVAERGRGWHAASIRDRLARARERGARYARASAGVGSVSERNFRRAGFEVLYTRTVWERLLLLNHK